MGVIMDVFAMLLRQRYKPDYVFSTTLVASQLMPYHFCANAVSSFDLRYTSWILRGMALLSSLYHACDEGLYCFGLQVKEWQRLDSLLTYTVVSEVAIQLSGLARFGYVRCQWLLRLAFFIFDFVLIQQSGVSIAVWQVHLGMIGVPILLILICWKACGMYAGVKAEAFVATMGLVMPGLVVLALGQNVGFDANKSAGSRKAKSDARGFILGTELPYFWFFHTLWHLIFSCSIYSALLCRNMDRIKIRSFEEQDKDYAAAKVEETPVVRRRRNRWWLTVLLTRYLPHRHRRDYEARRALEKRKGRPASQIENNVAQAEDKKES